MTTLAPSSTKRWATARPMPRLAPVMTATFPSKRPMSAHPFHDHGHAHAAADTHGFKADLLVMVLQRIQQRAGDTSPRHPERMTHRDRAAVDVQLVQRDIQRLRRSQGLHGESLVDF